MPTPQGDPFPPEVKQYLERDMLIVPLRTNSKVPAYKSLDEYINCVKERNVEECFKQYCKEGCNVGILLNPPTPYTRLILIDIDFKDEDTLNKIAEEIPCMLLWVEETKRGYHIYVVRSDDDTDATNKTIKTPKGNIDVKVNGYSVAYPSVVEGHQYKLYELKGKQVQVNNVCMMDYKDVIYMLERLFPQRTQQSKSKSKLPKELKELIELLKNDYVEGNRNNVVHALVGVLWRNGYDEDTIREFVVELGKTYNDEEVDPNKRDRKSVVSSTLRVCKEDPERCPSFKALKEVLNEETYKEVLKLFGRKQDKTPKVLLKKSTTVEEYLVMKKGFKVVKVRPMLGREVQKRVSETAYVSRKFSSVKKYYDENIGKGFVFKIDGELWYVHENNLEVFLKEKLGVDKKYVNHAIALLHNVQSTYDKPVVGGVWFDYTMTNGVKTYVSNVDEYYDWRIPHVEANLDVGELLKMYEAYGEAFIDALTMTLMMLLRLPLRKRGVHVPILVLAGRPDTGKTFLSEFLKETFDLRVLGEGVTRASVERSMSTSAVPFIIDTTNMSAVLKEINDVLVGAVSGQLKLRTVYHVHYKGTRFAFSLPLLVVNKPHVNEELFDKVAFILFDKELKVKKELLGEIGLEGLRGVGKALLEESIRVLKDYKVKGTTRVERVLDVFKVLKQQVCEIVGVQCAEGRVFLSYLNNVDNVIWSAERCKDCKEEDEGMVCECTMLGCARMGGKVVGRKRGHVKCLLPDWLVY